MMTTTLGSLASLHRYPVKSMMGEDLNVAHITQRGLFGDRAYALCDAETGKVVSAKNPQKWPNLFSYRAAYASPPAQGAAMPPVRVMVPDGDCAVSSNPDFATALSGKLGRPVKLLARRQRMPNSKNIGRTWRNWPIAMSSPTKPCRRARFSTSLSCTC